MWEALLDYSPALRSGFAGVEVCEETEAHGMCCSVHLGNWDLVGKSGRMDGGQICEAGEGDLRRGKGGWDTELGCERVCACENSSLAQLPPIVLVLREYAFKTLTAILVISALSFYTGSLRNQKPSPSRRQQHKVCTNK